LEEPKEFIRYNLAFCIPDARGRISDIHVEPAQTGYDLVVSCEVSSGISIKASCSFESGTPVVFESDAKLLNRFNINFLPTYAKAELLAKTELVDRYNYCSSATGNVATVIQIVPHVSITTQIVLPVRNEVLIGAQKMVEA
jgi:hypothetical protein